MGFFRSEIMKLYQLTAQKDDAITLMNALGDIGKLQFIDLNAEESPLLLPFTNQIRTIEESERKLQYLLDTCRNYNVKVTPPQSIDGFVKQLQTISQQKERGLNLLNDQIIKEIAEQEKFVENQLTQIQRSEATVISASDCLKVLQCAREMLPSLQREMNRNADESDRDQENLLGPSETTLVSVAGVVDALEIERLRRLLFRTTKGKSFIHIKEIDQNEEEDELLKKNRRAIYLIMFWDSSTLNQKIKKICDSFTGERFEIPTNANDYADRIQRVQQSLDDANQVLRRSRGSIQAQLREFDRVEGDVPEEGAPPASTIYIYKMFLAKEKTLNQTLNYVKWQESTFIGYFWAPLEDEVVIEEAIKNDYPSATITPESKYNITRPTYIKTNDFTAVFQGLVDTYGIPSYREANPALLTGVTFPFFFGMMFGDMGHGSILLVFASILVLFPGAFQGLPGGDGLVFARYFLFMLGIMAFYCGFIYNEWFAIPTNMFGSCYDLNIYNSQGEPLTPLSLSETPPSGALSVKTDDVPRVYRRHEAKCVYPFGEDPAWSVANNKLVFSNSIKMKMAVIFGVLHMTFGIIHKGLNSSFFRKWADLLSQVFTGFIILWGLFGWMDILIIFKFFRTVDIDDLSGGPTQLTDLQIDAFEREGNASISEAVGTPQYPAEVANSKMASIIQIIITAVFSPGTCPEDQKEMIGDYSPIGNICNLYNINLILLILVVISVPIMLFTVPCLTLCQPEHKQQDINQIEMSERDEGSPGVGVKAINDEADGQGDDPIDGRDAKLQGELRKLDKILREMQKADGPHTFGDAFIHSMIHTIEFVLGTVSNTASYLRLWALSLAHGQLSEVFFNLCFFQFINIFSFTNMWITVVATLFLWPVFWSVTFAVIMCMDLLECALHCLRLHWVEFQNKFFEGEGYAFRPYSFDTILTGVLQEE